jgi:hypothetical protein
VALALWRVTQAIAGRLIPEHGCLRLSSGLIIGLFHSFFHFHGPCIPDPLEGDPAAMKRRLLWNRGGVDPELVRAVPRRSGEVVKEVDGEGRPVRPGSG